MSQNPLDRVIRALDPNIRTVSTPSTRENPPTASSDPVTGVPEVSSTNVNSQINANVNTSSGGQTGPDNANIAGTSSSQSTNFSGFSPVISQIPSGPVNQLATQGPEGPVTAGAALATPVATIGDHDHVTAGQPPLISDLTVTRAAEGHALPDRNSDTNYELRQIRQHLHTISKQMRNKSGHRSPRPPSVASPERDATSARSRLLVKNDARKKQHRQISPRSTLSKSSTYISSDAISLHSNNYRPTVPFYRRKSLCNSNQSFISARIMMPVLFTLQTTLFALRFLLSPYHRPASK